MRKPVRKTSLFKFMTVLRLEVWLSIVGALTLTGIMIWILDKYSPYSARNNKRLYPYPCRYAFLIIHWYLVCMRYYSHYCHFINVISFRSIIVHYIVTCYVIFDLHVFLSFSLVCDIKINNIF